LTPPMIVIGAGVSIHAPARGATFCFLYTVTGLISFNPRTREGCDRKVGSAPWLRKRFQSTHPRGVRPQGARRSRHRKEVSIHAPARGATDGYCED